MKRDAGAWVQLCKNSQKRDPTLPKELVFVTGESTLFGQVSMDAVHIKAGKYKCLIVSCDKLSEFMKAEALVKLDSRSVSCFFTQICLHQYGLCLCVTVDGGPKSQGNLIDGLEWYGVMRDSITPYYPEARGMIEKGH